ncbi:bifunctional methylenetetrahydrofolate dehydrogenase/methenyltetrahydrofolate cyclohydrolase FolD [Ostreibacterium oceani]|uniref:Bifunctional protein FolD n=1 Tax=Ostreibacterium oceani TaxID=2654998 RepID=A0A6N7EZE3_9GAMM|nr:bifunctional methylenetetrahydrofolate dehydrogenase/methenyltetrahydrofolate cyclohydrolase FolD [Ostreibacterium oceani]MPV86547.1 bifunctional methylenetetrahydrofolate dehydrogenase/methenyltetrahydrofolate cyclohydrolase FolD [Ostreibacterium oceani]
MTQIIDGKAFAAKLRQDIKQQTDLLKSQGITPGLAVVLVGEDPASQVYVRNKGKQSIEVGFKSIEHKLDATVSQAELLDLIQQLNQDDSIHGILVQLPVPKHIDDKAVINAIAPEKDVDGFSQLNVGRLNIGEQSLVPCTPLGCTMLLKDYFGGDLTGKNAVVLGRSNIVGKPMAALLLQESCTVTIAHSKTKDIETVCRAADIVVAAVGRPQMVKKSWIGEGAVVIDVGINRIDVDGKTKLVGDVDYDDVFDNAAAITPVPGGVGPMTIACLLYNTLTAAKMQRGIE